MGQKFPIKITRVVFTEFHQVGTKLVDQFTVFGHVCPLLNSLQSFILGLKNHDKKSSD